MRINPVELSILSIINDDMRKNGFDMSFITNTKISQITGYSVYNIRDCIVKMNKKGILNNLVNHWDSTDKFHNRIIQKGQNYPKIKFD
jgi:hypothetical protein